MIFAIALLLLIGLCVLQAAPGASATTERLEGGGAQVLYRSDSGSGASRALNCVAVRPT
jgi:hypothetical protein